MSQFLKELTNPSDPFYLRLIKGSNATMPEFMNRGVFYTGTSGFGGVVTTNTTNPLIDVRDYIYTSGTTSNLDFWGYNFDVPTGIKSTDVSFEFNYKTSVSNFNVTIYALCSSGNRQIDATPNLEVGTKTYKRVFTVPFDCTGLKIGWQYNGNTSGETFEYDNVVFRSNGYQVASTIEQETFTGTYQQTGTTGIITSIGTIKSTISRLLTAPTISSGKITFTSQKRATYVITSNVVSSNNSAGMSVTVNGVAVASATSTVSNSNPGFGGSVTYDAIPGDIFIISVGTQASNSGYFSITATAISENVIQSYAPSDFLGELRFLPQNIAPKGFIPAMGSSIGKSSGTYQGDAYYELYKLLWTQSSVTAGEPYVISSAKGADALTDWNAAKTITIDVSGLFVRAYKSGTSGAVGAKQADAFQGHRHEVRQENGNAPSSVPSNSQSLFGANSIIANTNAIRDPITDGTNGTPRTASETRPTNLAQYAFIRYGNDAPTLLALPSSKENVFSARIDTSGNIISKSSDWIQSVTQSGTGNNIKTITFKSGIFTVAPSITSMVEDASASPSVYVSSANGLVTSTTAVLTVYNDSGVIPSTNHGITIIAQKQSPDYTAPGVFVGNVAKNQVATLYANPATVASIAGGFVDLTWDGSSGDTSIITHTAGQANFTLQPGEYLIESEGLCYKTNAAYHQLYSVTTASIIENTVFAYANTVVGEVITKNGGKFMKLSVMSPTVFKIRQFAYAAHPTGFGDVNWAWSTRAKLQITKLNGQ